MVSRYIHLNPIRAKAMLTVPEEEKFQYLEDYKWSSLPGYIDKKKRNGFIDYEPILTECCGVNAKGRKGYRKLIYYNITRGLEIKKDIVGQCILGGEEFVKIGERRSIE